MGVLIRSPRAGSITPPGSRRSYVWPSPGAEVAVADADREFVLENVEGARVARKDVDEPSPVGPNVVEIGTPDTPGEDFTPVGDGGTTTEGTE